MAHSAPPLRVLLVDDHAIVRSGIRFLLSQIDGVCIIGEAADGVQALLLADSEGPDLLITDIGMKGMNGLETARRFAVRKPAPKILVLSVYSDENYVVQALAAGADGYLLKDSASDQLEQAVSTVTKGEQFIDPQISRERLAEHFTRLKETGNPAAVLTARQREILQSIAEGESTKQMAHRLGLSNKTVEAHRAQIMERLQIHEVAGLVRYALRTGLTTLDR